MQEGSIKTAPAPGEGPDVLVITIDRPPVNALSLDMLRHLRDVFSAIDQISPKARAVVLTGAGRVFSGGADVKELSERTVEEQMRRSAVSRGAFDAVRRCPIPVIVAVNGPAVGAGAVIASCADIILAAETATFALPEVLVGVMGGTRHMSRLVPDKVVRYLALTGRKVDARYLERFGGIQDVLPADELLPAALALAGEIAGNSPTATQMMKEALNLTEDMPLNDGYRVEQLFTTLASALPDSREAAQAFLEKRKPVWSR